MFCLSILLASIVHSQQIKLPRDYQYFFKEETVTFEKGLELLQTGNYHAEISDGDKTVTIVKTKSVVGQDFPFKDFVDLNGNTHTVEDLRGKVLAINYWFVGCRPCIEEMPELNDLVESYKSKEVVFLALANDPAPRITKFLTKFDFDYTIVPDEMQFGLDLGVRAYPTHMFVAKDGRIAEVFSGQYEGVGNKVARKIDKLLK